MKFITKYDRKGRDMPTFPIDDEGEQDIVCNYAHILWDWSASSSLGSHQKNNMSQDFLNQARLQKENIVLCSEFYNQSMIFSV